MALMIKVITFLALLVAASAAAAAPRPSIQCGTVTKTLAPCFGYVLSGGTVPPNCCYGVKSLYKMASTTAARRQVCYCLKEVTKNISASQAGNAKDLPRICGVSLSFQISPSMDCAKLT